MRRKAGCQDKVHLGSSVSTSPNATGTVVHFSVSRLGNVTCMHPCVAPVQVKKQTLANVSMQSVGSWKEPTFVCG